MTDSARFDDIYSRLNQLTADVSNLKIQASTYGTTQNATVQAVDMIITLTSEVRGIKAEMREMRSDIAEILRILRDRNGGTSI
ncbi:hypothetical protein H6G81_23780 [Scytonema hofmannii FACHB-248]|jgi:ribosomal protein L29|uniref:Coil containing protein n=1 Tax=Scytonema hofmannii FACHB-248 TaxID=1842502 RepID=A0ABR8GWI7_9CYAN|nr:MULTISPECIES: hypothetical protein [Nostocales]MBD2607464.1 hypothetical protein [Scytonema hofmannii FACHB-248]